MSELYDALLQIKAAARQNNWYAFPEGSPERDAYTAATKAINNHVSEKIVTKTKAPVKKKGK
jgi:hypothetical protein